MVIAPMKVNRNLHPRGPAGRRIARSEASSRQRILVAEDDSSILRLSTQVLIQSGYGVESAADGAAAWDALSTDPFDLLITDNNMPEVTGVELLKKLHDARMVLPVIMATGALPTEEFARYPWLKPNATLQKPYTMADLLLTVDEVLRAAAGAREQTGPRPNWQSRPAEDVPMG